MFLVNGNVAVGAPGNNSSRENSVDRISSASAASSSRRCTTSPRPESLRYPQNYQYV